MFLPISFLCSISHPSVCPGVHRPRGCNTLLLKEVYALLLLLLLLPPMQKNSPRRPRWRGCVPAALAGGRVGPSGRCCPRPCPWCRGCRAGREEPLPGPPPLSPAPRWAGRGEGNVQVVGRSGTPRKAGGGTRTDRRGAAGETGAELQVKLRRTKPPKFWVFFLR